MADDVKIVLGVELDKSSIDSQVAEITNKIKSKKDAKLTLDVLKGESNTNIRKFVDQVQSTYKGKPIKLAVDIDATQFNKSLQNLIKQIQNAQKQLSNMPNLPTGNGGSGGGKFGGRKSGGKLPTTGFPVSRRKWATKYRDAADAEEQKVIQSLLGKNATLVSTSGRQKYDKTGKETGSEWLVTYRNEIGKTVKAIMSYNKEADKWRVNGTTITTNYEEQTKALKKQREEVLKNLSKWDTQLAEKKDVAFSRDKQLTGAFATPVNDQIKIIENRLNAIRKSGTTDLAKDIREITAEFGKLDTLTKNQKALQYAPTKLKNVDTTESVKRYTNYLDELENKLKSTGQLTASFQQEIATIRTGFGNVGQQNADDLSTWIDKFGTLKSEIQQFQSSVQGKGLKLAFDIDTNQISQIDTALKNVNDYISQRGSTSGVEALRNNFESIKSEYQSVIKDLQSDTLTEDQFKNLSQRAGELKEQLTEAANAAKIFGDGFKDKQALEAYDNKVENLTKRFENYVQKYREFVEKNPTKANANIEQQIQDISAAFKDIDPVNFKNVQSAVQSLGTSLSGIQPIAKSIGAAFRESFGAVGQYLARFVSAYAILNKGISTIKSMVTEVKSLDTAIMELTKVTDLAGNSLNSFVDNAYKIGKEVGRTGKDVIEATTTFSRAGYNLQESMELSKAALVMTNVGVDIPNMESAASDMISIMKAFDKQAEDSMDIIDKLYNVANKEPLDFGNITEMLVTSGGTLSQSGTSLEQTMGLLTGGFATLRNSSVANG